MVRLKAGSQPNSYMYDSGNKDPLASQSTRSRIFSHFGQTSFEGRGSGISKQVLVIDDDYDNAFTVKSCLESHCRQDNVGSEFHPIQVTIYVDPLLALLEFKPYYYDLLLIDISMPSISGYMLTEKIVKLDLNIKICFMSAGEINYEAIREIRHPSKSFGCFIKKPASSTYLVNRVLQELY
jgi:CheY-like chemotaxis protein